MRTGAMDSGDATVMDAETVLPEKETQLLARVRQGHVPCPWCDRMLRGEPVCLELPDDDFYAGVRLSCSCGFVEY